MDKLKINKSVCLASRVKELKYEIADCLAKICNVSLRLTSVLEDWKAANRTLIFLKKSRELRPAGITSVVMESLLKISFYQAFRTGVGNLFQPEYHIPPWGTFWGGCLPLLGQRGK